MRASTLQFLAQLCILLAIATSVALLIDTLGVTPAYCSGATGCHAAKLAAKRVLGPVPLPLLGLLAFSGWLAATTLQHGRWVRKLHTAGSCVAALSGIGFLLIQAFVLKTFCPLCVIVDASAILAGIGLLLANRSAVATSSPPWLHPLALGALALVAVVAPTVWPHFRPAAALPAQLAGFSAPGRVTVVEFVDLSCGHCRALYPTIEQLRREQGNRIDFVRLHAPLRSHRYAREAARLLQCLQPDEARVEKLTEVLFENPQLDHASITAAAEYVGMTEEQIAACWADPSSDAALDDNIQRLESMGFQGLPTTYIGGERIVGNLPLIVYVDALDRVRRSSGSAGAQNATFYVIVGMLVLAIVIASRRRTGATVA